MGKPIYTVVFLIFISYNALSQSDRLNNIKMQIKEINSSLALKTVSYDLKEFKKGNGFIEIGKINNKIKRITTESKSYNYSEMTIIYLRKEKPILVQKETKSVRTAYLTNGEIETDQLHHMSNFYVVNWKNEIYIKDTPKSCAPFPEKISKYRIEEIVNLTKNIVK